MSVGELVGWLAAGSMIATFSSKKKVTLRGFAVASNLLFILYGMSAQLFPILVLHLILLPINLVKFLNMKNRQFKIKPRKKLAQPSDSDHRL
jgi:hypothetical protein